MAQVTLYVAALASLLVIAGPSDAAGGLLSARQMILTPGMPSVEAKGLAPIYPTPPDGDILKADAGIEPEQPYRWITSPGKPFRIAVRCSDKRVTDCALTVWDWDYRPVAQIRYKVPFADSVTLTSKGRGVYLLTLDGMMGETCVWRLPRSFAACPSNERKRRLWSNDRFWVGQVTIPGMQWLPLADGRFVHPPGLTEVQSADLDAELAARMGVPIARPYMLIDRRDQAGMDLDFSRSDKWVAIYAARRFKLDLQLGVPVGEGMGPILPQYDTPSPWIYPIKEAPYRRFVRDTVKRYGKYCRFVQVNNEPDNYGMFRGTSDEFIAMMAQAREEIAKVDPSMPITNGGYCLVDPAKTAAIVPGIKGLTDFVSYHCHGYVSDLATISAQIRQMHREAGYVNPQFAITEMGAMTESIAAEGIGAYTEMQKIFYAWAHDNRGVMLYSSRELQWPRQHENEYGFVDYFFCPRFVYGAVSAFLDRYAGMHFERILMESDNLRVYVFRGNGKTMAAVFASSSPIDVTLSGSTNCSAILDPMGNSKSSGRAKTVQLRASAYPQTVVFQGDCDVKLQTPTK